MGNLFGKATEPVPLEDTAAYAVGSAKQSLVQLREELGVIADRTSGAVEWPLVRCENAVDNLERRLERLSQAVSREETQCTTS